MKKYIFLPSGNRKVPTRFSKKYVNVIQSFRRLLMNREESYSSMSEMYRDIECLAFPHLSKVKSKSPIYTPQQFSRVVEVALNLGWISFGESPGTRIPVLINMAALSTNRFSPDDYIAFANGAAQKPKAEVHETYVTSGANIPNTARINILPQQTSDPAYTYVSTISSTMGFGKYEFVK